jgi:hypothetical protein
MIRVAGLCFCVFIIVTVGCRRQPEANILARVGDATLTLDEAKAYVDTTRTPYDDRVRAYVNKWVEDEIFYLEALGKGLQNTEQYKKQMLELGRQITIQNFLQQEIYQDTTKISDEALGQYFANHQSEFYVREDMVRLNLITFSERKPAVTFVAALNSGTLWTEAANGVANDTSSAKKIIVREENRIYTRKTLFPTELWRVASILGPGEISFPVKTSIGYSVLQALDKLKAGSPATIDVVYDEVKMRLIIEERRSRYDDLIHRLRGKYHVEIFGRIEKETDSVYTPSQ